MRIKNKKTSIFSYSKIELGALFTIAFVLANSIVFMLQFGYLSYYGIAYDYININLTGQIIIFIISVFTIGICKIIMDSYVDIYTRMYIKKEKYFFQLTSRGIKCIPIKLKKKRFLKIFFYSSFLYIFLMLLYISLNVIYEANPLGIDIFDFVLIFIASPLLLVIITIILIITTNYIKKLQQVVENYFYKYNNILYKYKKRSISKANKKITIEDVKKKIFSTYLFVSVLCLLILMFFLFFSGELIAQNKLKYGTFYDEVTEKNYLIITAYNDYRIVMEYTYDESNDVAEIVYGEYSIVPLEEISENVKNFKDIKLNNINYSSARK